MLANIFLSQPMWRLGAFLLFLGLASALPAQIVINEVLFYQDENATDPTENHDWIEIFNKGVDEASLLNWRFVNQNGDILAILPDIDLPAGAYLVVHFSEGTNDFDFSDLQGSLYTGAAAGFDALLHGQDALALFSGPVDPDNLRDFLSWLHDAAPYAPTGLDTLAWITGNWPEDQFFNALTGATGMSAWKRQPVWAGSSIGRNRLSEDPNAPSEWGAYGGIDALQRTPGGANHGTGELYFQEALSGGATAGWTVMIYMAGDNNLERALLEDLDEMGLLGSNENLNIVVQADFHPGHADVQMTYDDGASWIQTDGAIRARLAGDDVSYRATFETIDQIDPFLGEVNMGDPAALADFIQWSQANYPADKYALILWGNGGGWKYMNLDDTDSDALHMQELGDALQQGGVFFEMIGFDQSHAALIETAWQAAPHAKYMLASQENITQKGFAYEPVIETLRDVPSYNGLDLAALFINTFGAYHGAGKHYDPAHTLSSFALDNRLAIMAGHFSSLAEELRLGMEDDIQMAVRDERINALAFQDPNYIDLRHFVRLVSENADIDEAYKTHALIVLISAGDAVQHYHNGPLQLQARGMSIYFPFHQTKDTIAWGDSFDDPEGSFLTSMQDGVQARYAADTDDETPVNDPVNHPIPPAPGFRFVQDYQWDEMLHRYYEPVAKAGPDVVVSVNGALTLDGSASTCADGAVARWVWTFDGNELEGQTVSFPTQTPGQYVVTLTVWSDHHELYHADHFEIDRDTLVVSVVDELLIVDIIIADATCYDQNNGSAELILAGGEAPYVIEWSNGQTGNPAANLGAGSYSVTATDAEGTMVSANFVISEPTAIEATAAYVQPACPTGATGSISLTATGGVGPYEFFWNTGDTGSVLANVTAGIYFAFVIDANGCILTEPFELESNDSIPPMIIANDATVSLDPVTGAAIMQPTTFISQISDNCGIGGVSLMPVLLDCDNLGPNTITIAAIDDSGNITTVQVVATIVDDAPPSLAPVNIIVALGADGTVTVAPELLAGGSFDNCGIVSYFLDVDFFDCSNIGDNPVTLSAVDGSGNFSSEDAIITIVDNTPPTVVTQNITLSLDADGNASLVPSDLDGGSFDNCGILVLQASQTSFSCADLAQGPPLVIALTLTDVNGNESTATALVTLIDTIPPTITCPDDIFLSFCEPVAFDLPLVEDNCGYTLFQTDGLPSGSIFSYGETIQGFQATDDYGNTAACSFSIIVLSDLIIEATITHVSCNGLADGSIETVVSGGTPPYVFFWSGGGNTNLSSGIYTLTVFDNNGCESMRTYQVNEPQPIEVGVINVADETNGQSNGSFTLVVSGGTPPYVYMGMSFSDSLTVSGLSAGSYSISLTDANGCAASATATIDNISGVSEPQSLQQFSVYPNPAGASVTVDIRLSDAALMQLSLSDATGRILQSWAPMVARERQTRIELDALAPGMYMLKLTTEEGVAVRKLIKVSK